MRLGKQFCKHDEIPGASCAENVACFCLRGERWKLLCITSLIWALSDLIGSL